MKNKKGFTLTELLMALLIAGTLIGIVMSIYTGIMGADLRMSNKRVLTSEASDLLDMIHTVALDYTIDYEEYFNRSSLGYGLGDTRFTSYGNAGERYYCGNNFSGRNNGSNNSYQIYKRNGSGCQQTGRNQKYLEYQFQHRMLATGDLNNKENSGSYMNYGPVAISPNTGLDYLYLISPDGSERYYFRRVLAGGNGGTGKNDKLYVIQMLRLKGYDAGENHNFDGDTYSWGRYDGFIDTRACDFSQGFNCNGTGVTGGDKMPGSFSDGRVNITSDKVTVNDFRIDIYPDKDPYLYTLSDNLIDPYIKITITMNMYNKPSDDEITLSTTLSFKNSYFNYPIEVRPCVPNDNGYDTVCPIANE